VGLLDARPIRTLGLSSYSLYLIHAPIVAVVYALIVRPRYHHGPMAFLVMVAIVVPVTIAFARVFAAVFERPFLRQSGLAQLLLLRHLRFRRVAHLRP
ncbi:MAG TPA: acyltransferase, partial [Candidatus Dormibacteraeota bacterium]|nr:acyltransferase [Candidatus Dormibacteraeota bacterium]